MKTDNFTVPPSLRKLWPWFNAVSAWDWGDPGPLGEIVQSEPIPEEFREAIADILMGDRNRQKNWQKGKIPAAERMVIAATVSAHIDHCRAIRSNNLEGDESLADQLEMEPIDMVYLMHATVRSVVADVAQEFDVSVETVENLLRDMRARINRWPVV